MQERMIRVIVHCCCIPFLLTCSCSFFLPHSIFSLFPPFACLFHFLLCLTSSPLPSTHASSLPPLLFSPLTSPLHILYSPLLPTHPFSPSPSVSPPPPLLFNPLISHVSTSSWSPSLLPFVAAFRNTISSSLAGVTTTTFPHSWVAMATAPHRSHCQGMYTEN